MSRGRPARTARRVSSNPMWLVKNLAAVLTPAEIASTIEPLKAAAAALRQGVATERQWQMVASAANVADVIEEQGVVRGKRLAVPP